MPLRIVSILCNFLIISLSAHAQLPPVGQWRDHLPYHQTKRVIVETTGNNSILWCATPYSVFNVDPSDKSIERWSKISGLSETGVSTIGLEPTSRQLIIAYNNSNVDIVDNNTVKNINAIRHSTISGNKTIYHIIAKDRLAYLSTGLGIIVLDLDKYQVKETWIIGNGGNKTKVTATTRDAAFMYAATDDGLKRAPANASNLADFRNWQLISGSNGLPSGPVTSVEKIQNNVIVLKNDSLYIHDGSSNPWQFLYANDWTITDLSVSGNKLLLSETLNNAGRIVSLLLNGTVDRTIQHSSFTKSPQQAVLLQNDYWIADGSSGLTRYDGNNFESFVPNSPLSVATGSMQVMDDVLWVAAGGVNTNWEPVSNSNGLYQFSNDTWTNFNATAPSPQKLPDSLQDYITVAIDPIDKTLWAGSYGGGLMHHAGNIQVFKQNSQIRPAYFSPDSYRVSGLTFDAEGNLWIANYGSPGEIVVRKKDGTMHAFTIPFSVPENGVSQIITDDFHQLWIVSPKGNGLFCFNYGSSIENTGDDRWKWYRAGRGSGNLPDNDVLSIAMDKNSIIWVGTARGVGLIQCAQEAFSPAGCEAVLPVVQQDNFAGYLFSNERVQSIAVDGADRKWIATQHGVWLISADGEKTIYRFTQENSPLVSDDVTQIAINGNTGEVFFSTPNGICSFRSTATEGTSTNSNVLVFPNPVPPGYNGTIAIRGVANNSIVKITELDGRLVYQARALGGQAIWNGKNYKGVTTATGIYLVVIRDDAGNEKMVTKIVFIKK